MTLDIIAFGVTFLIIFPIDSGVLPQSVRILRTKARPSDIFDCVVYCEYIHSA